VFLRLCHPPKGKSPFGEMPLSLGTWRLGSSPDYSSPALLRKQEDVRVLPEQLGTEPN